MGTFTVKHIQKLEEEALKACLSGWVVLTPYSHQALAEIYNGIGPDRFPEWLRKIITGYGEIFEPAALIHDVRYHIGGTKKDFTSANDEFRENCYLLVKGKYEWWRPMRYILMNKGRRWSNYCEEFGLSGYNLTKKEASNV